MLKTTLRLILDFMFQLNLNNFTFSLGALIQSHRIINSTTMSLYRREKTEAQQLSHGKMQMKVNEEEKIPLER